MKIQYHSETGTCSVLNAGYRIGRDTWGIHVSESRAELKSTQTNAVIFGLVRIGVCLSISSTLIKPFMYSNCLVTLSHLSLHYNSSVCFPFVPSFAERLGLWEHEPLNFGCLSFAERLAFLFLPRYCFNKNGLTLDKRPHVSTSLIQGGKIKPNNGPGIRTPLVEIWQCAGAMWT